MTIDEAISHAREEAKEKYTEAMLCHANPNDEKLDGCIECAREHEQIAELLEELKAYRENSNGYSKEDIELNRKAMYNKALDDLIEAAEKSQYGDVDGKEYVMEHLKALAERLKEGGENETVL